MRKGWGKPRQYKFLKNVGEGIKADSDQAVFKHYAHSISVLLWEVEVGDGARGKVPHNGRDIRLPVSIVALADH